MAVPVKKAAAPRRPAAKKNPGVTKLVYEADFKKETPGALQYAEDSERVNQVSGVIYLRKGPLEGTQPQRIRVTIEVI